MTGPQSPLFNLVPLPDTPRALPCAMARPAAPGAHPGPCGPDGRKCHLASRENPQGGKGV
eukprot:7118708-Prymnesium_polylepis.1